MNALGNIASQAETSLPANAASSDAVSPSVQETIRLADSLSYPIEIGELAVCADGKRLFKNKDQQTLHFSFLYANRRIYVEINLARALLSLRAPLGKMPYTAEHPVARALLKSIISRVRTLPRGKLTLTRQQGVELSGQAEMPSPYTPHAMLATIGALMLDFLPFYDLLEQEFQAYDLPQI